MVTETEGQVKYRPAMEPIAGVYDGLRGATGIGGRLPNPSEDIF